MGAIPPHIAITYQPKSVYELGKRGVPSARPSTTISPDTCKPMTQPLSPAAQAVLDAAVLPCTIREGIAAAIRAVADRVVPEAANAVGDEHDEARLDQWLRIRWKILAIATELEALQ